MRLAVLVAAAIVCALSARPADEVFPAAAATLSAGTGSPQPQAGGACVSRRRISMRLDRPRGATITSAIVTVRGRSQSFRRPRRVLVDLRGLPAGRYRVRVVARTDTGRTLRITRTYRTCATA